MQEDKKFCSDNNSMKLIEGFNEDAHDKSLVSSNSPFK